MAKKKQDDSKQEKELSEIERLEKRLNEQRLQCSKTRKALKNAKAAKEQAEKLEAERALNAAARAFMEWGKKYSIIMADGSEMTVYEIWQSMGEKGNQGR